MVLLSLYDCEMKYDRRLQVKGELMMLKEGVMLLLVRFLHIWQGNLWFQKSYLIHLL